MTTTRTWEDNAAEYRELVAEAEGWVLGGLVACGAQSQSQRPRDILKTSWESFGNQAGVSVDSVRRAYTAWERAADAGLVPHANTLEPADYDALLAKLPSNVEHPWKEFHKGQSRNEKTDKEKRVLNQDPAALMAAMTDEQRNAITREAVRTATAEQIVAAVAPDVLPNLIQKAVAAEPERYVAPISEVFNTNETFADGVYRNSIPAVGRARDRRTKDVGLQVEMEALAATGRSTPEGDDEGHVLDGYVFRMETLADAERYVQKAVQCLEQLRPLNEREQESVRGFALMIANTLDVEQGAKNG